MGNFDIHFVGRIDINLYKAIVPDIATDIVIITDERVQHIRQRHPNDYEQHQRYMCELVETPDYILEANRPHSVVLLKAFSEEGKQFKAILRLHMSTDDSNYQNSIITFMKIRASKYEQYKRTKIILYKRE